MLGERIQIRGRHFGVTVRAEVVGAQRIDRDHDDGRGLGEREASCGRQKRGQRVDSLPRDSPRIAQSAACIHGALTCWEVAYKAYGEIGTELDGWAHILFARFHQALNLGDDSTTRRLEESIGYLHAHYHEEIDVPALAAQCGYSEGYYYRVFKRLTGKTPIQYLMAVRVREALRWLVHSDLPIHRIAAAVGFADPHYFTRVIKQATGSTPCALRRNAAAAAE